MTRKKLVFTYICEDCIFLFQTFSKIGGNNVFCPKCGESISTQSYQQKNMPVKRVQIHFTDEELIVLERVLKGEILPFQAAILLGRTQDSVRKKIGRMRKEREYGKER